MNLFYDFSIPTRIARCQTEKEIVFLINKWNGLVPCYLSVNPYEILSIDEFNNEIRFTHITKAFFDFDDDLESVKKFVGYLIDKDIKFEIFHSGRGHHIYVHVGGVGNSHNLRILQLSLLNDAKSKCDMHVIGDTQRVSRIPNTWNFKSETFCVPIRLEELGKEDGSKQRLNERFIYGTNVLNLSTFTEDKFEHIKQDIIVDMQINTKISLLPCIRNIVKKINPTQTERYTLVVYLSNALRNGKDIRGFDQGLLIEQIKTFFCENCSHWMDFNIQKTMYQIRNIMPKTNLIVGCRFLKSKGICVGCLPNGI
jgi:hypothetical protein